MAHTPAPWKVFPGNQDGEWYIARAGEARPIAQLVWERDAYLIAASPDLFDALQRLRLACLAPDDPRRPAAMTAAWGALRKAEGR